MTVPESENDEDAEEDGFDEEQEVSTQPAAVFYADATTKRGRASRNRKGGASRKSKQKVPSDASDNDGSPPE